MNIFVKPRKAATVAVIKDSPDSAEMQVLLMKRHEKDRFLPGYHVFPGGGVEEQDSPGETAEHPASLTGMFSSREDRISYMTHMMCAIRETFEESGLLLAESGGAYIDLSNPAEHEKYSSYRKMILSGELKLSEMLRSEKLEPSFSKIHYLTRWVTPPFSPIRYDTRFFVAVYPSGQNINHDGEELVTSEWISPGKALTLHKKGKMKLVTPTSSTLEFLEGFKTSEEVMNHFTSEIDISPARSF